MNSSLQKKGETFQHREPNILMRRTLEFLNSNQNEACLYGARRLCAQGHCHAEMCVCVCVCPSTWLQSEGLKKSLKSEELVKGVLTSGPNVCCWMKISVFEL